MEKVILTLVAAAVFCGTSVSAICDNTTAAKIKACVFKSDLFKPSDIPSDDEDVVSYCRSNATINCVNTEMGDCHADDRQIRLMHNLVVIGNVAMKQEALCNGTNGGADATCYPKVEDPTVRQCLTNAAGELTNAGNPSNLKSGLDAMCTFFDAYAICMPTECQMFKDAVAGIRYKYCGLSADEKKRVVTEYETGVSSAPLFALSLMSILAAIVATLFM